MLFLYNRFANVLMNQGALSNKGLKSLWMQTLFVSKDFTWNVSGNIGFNSSKIENWALPLSCMEITSIQLI